MTLQEWFKTQGYGAVAKCSKATGFHRIHISRVASGAANASPFFAEIMREYTQGAVCVTAKPRPISGYLTTCHSIKGHRAYYGYKYLGTRPTREAAQALLDEYTAGVGA